MKKSIFSIFALVLLSLASCSSDDNATTDPATSSDILVKRIINTQEDPEGFNDIITFTYNGNKLQEANYLDGTKEKYYYTGDLITKVEYIFEGEVEEQDVFIYDSDGRLIEYKNEDLIEDFEERSLFAYNSGNTITETTFVGSTPYTRTITIENDEIVKIVDNAPGGKTYKYSYDTKNSPFKNVTGYAKIAYAFGGDFELLGKKHNISLIRNETDSYDYMSNTIQYNSNDYPTRVVSQAAFNSATDIENLTVQYFYE